MPCRENLSVQIPKILLKLLDQTSFNQWCAPYAGNPPSYPLLLPWMEDGTCSCCRMVWVEYCIPKTKLGTREVGSFTTELSSMAFILKTLKTVVL